MPKLLLSDNASQFRLAATTFDIGWREVLKDESLQQYLSSRQVQWRFTTECAPWQGGVYERLIGVVKRCVRKTIGRRLLTQGKLTTMLAEVEAIVNTRLRPLTYVPGGEDSLDGVVLTPAHFIANERSLGIPIPSATLEDIDFALHRDPDDAICIA